MMAAESRYEKFRANGVGLENGSIRLAPHERRWKRVFAAEAHLIFDTVRDESLRLYHCGSTAVADLEAKPIIDILGSVRSLEEFDRRSDKLRSLGYHARGENGIAGRRYFVLSDEKQTFVHLHIFEHSSCEVERHLTFRDQLRRSEAARTQYQEVKRHAEMSALRDDYTALKSDVIAALQPKEGFNARKVLVILGSAPGHEKTLQAARENYRDEDAEFIDLGELAIGGYDYNSVRDEKLTARYNELARRMVASDLVVLATPVYWYTMSGCLKNFVDRFSNLLSGSGKRIGEDLEGLRVEIFATGYDEALPLGFEVPFALTCVYFSMDYMGATYVCTAPEM